MRAAPSYALAIAAVFAPSLTAFGNFAPPLFPQIWIVAILVSAIVVFLVTRATTPPAPNLERRSLSWIAGAIAFLVVYIVLLRTTTVVAPGAGLRFQAGFGTARWSLTDDGKKLAAALGNPSSRDLMLADTAFNEGGPSRLWTDWSIALAGGGLIVAHISSFVALAIGCAMVLQVSRADAGRPQRAREPVVFISYDHEDEDRAISVRDVLRLSGIEVIIDRDSMTPGESIPDFITRALRAADVVISVVSSRSLVSGWVAAETISRLSQQQWDTSKLLIGGYLDRDLFQPDFRLRATKIIDQRREEIEAAIHAAEEQNLDSVELEGEKARLYRVRNHLGEILAQLKNTRMVDLSPEGLDEQKTALIEAIRNHVLSARQRASGAGYSGV